MHSAAMAAELRVRVYTGGQGGNLGRVEVADLYGRGQLGFPIELNELLIGGDALDAARNHEDVDVRQDEPHIVDRHPRSHRQGGRVAQCLHACAHGGG